MKKLLYTCITNGYDSRKRHAIPAGWDFIEMNLSGDRLRAREMKILNPFFDQYDLSVWMDGSMLVHGRLDLMTQVFHGEHQFTTVKHYHRDCIFREMDACLLSGFEDIQKVLVLQDLYQREGYPRNNGLIASGFMIRSHTPEVKRLCEQWFSMVKQYSLRDQLSFNYVAWKQKFKYNTIDLVTFKKFITKSKHLK